MFANKLGMLGKCTHPQLLNKEDSGDGTVVMGLVPKYSSMYFPMMSSFVVTPTTHSKILLLLLLYIYKTHQQIGVVQR